MRGFDFNSFSDFVDGKTIHYLESASTILYYMGCEENFTREDAIEKLQVIKPHIDSEIVGNAYNDMIRFNCVFVSFILTQVFAFSIDIIQVLI